MRGSIGPPSTLLTVTVASADDDDVERTTSSNRLRSSVELAASLVKAIRTVLDPLGSTPMAYVDQVVADTVCVRTTAPLTEITIVGHTPPSELPRATTPNALVPSPINVSWR